MEKQNETQKHIRVRIGRGRGTGARVRSAPDLVARIKAFRPAAIKAAHVTGLSRGGDAHMLLLSGLGPTHGHGGRDRPPARASRLLASPPAAVYLASLAMVVTAKAAAIPQGRGPARSNSASTFFLCVTGEPAQLRLHSIRTCPAAPARLWSLGICSLLASPA